MRILYLFLLLTVFLSSACSTRVDPARQFADLSIQYQQMIAGNPSANDWYLLLQQLQKIANNQENDIAMEAHWGIALCWMALAKLENSVAISRAVEVLQGHLTQYPSSSHYAEAYCWIGYYTNLLAQPAIAIEHYQMMIHKYPDHPLTPSAQKSLVDIYMEQKNVVAVLQLYQSLQQSKVSLLAQEAKAQLRLPQIQMPKIELIDGGSPIAARSTPITSQTEPKVIASSENKERGGNSAKPVASKTDLPREQLTVEVPSSPNHQARTQQPSLVQQLGLGVKTIVIDPGHGGKDPGAVSRYGAEKTVVLQVTRMLSDELTAHGYQVYLTRKTDQTTSLNERTALVNRMDADLFLSLHANASPKKDAAGIETYYLALGSDQTSKMVAMRENAGMQQSIKELESLVSTILKGSKSQESRRLAEIVQQQLVEKTEAKDRGVKHAPFIVLTGTKIPAILIEIGFISNPEEAVQLKTATYQRQIAEAIAEGINRYAKQAPLPQEGQSLR
ncbi:MAG: N-acetylmuramoyl-L-alanine amidase [Candidatus Poribacteria bacterium]|nr:N-acetylmuramoyl-L-alanine amidase [Candidatus Poribacteria bacterium]